MGFLKDLASVAAPIAGTFLGGPLGGAIGGMIGGSLGGGAKQSGTQTSTTQQQLDPRLQQLLYGTEGGTGGLLQKLTEQANQPGQGAGFSDFNRGIGDYIGGYGVDTFRRNQQMAQNLQEQRNSAPQVGWSGDSSGIKAPAQNSLNLKPAFQNFIYGNSAENPYLLKSLQAGVDLGNAGYRSNVESLTDTLQRQILPDIRGGAIASGQYGGSRQGIAEGNAISDFTKQLTNTNLQQSLGQTQGILGAQSDTFNRGQDRALSAAQGLSGQQYNVASQNEQIAMANADRNLRRDMANQSAVLQTNQQNDARNIAGTGLSSSLLGQAVGYGTAGNNADLDRLTRVTGSLAPYTGAGGTTTNSQPLYENKGAGILGGAAAGLGLYNQFSNLFGGSTVSGIKTGQGSYGGGPAGTYYDGHGWVPIG